MTEDPDTRAGRVTASRLRSVAGALGLDACGYARALKLGGSAPDLARWRTLLSSFLLGVGAALILTGIAAFFAYNWSGLPRLAKLGLIETGLVACVAAAAWRSLDSGLGRSALFAAAVLCGILLAVFGQAYQTGADPYGLFLGWMLLILPWALIGRQAGLWMLALVLANLALILFWQQVLVAGEDPVGELAQLLGPGPMLVAFLVDFRLAQLVFALNVCAMLAWEYLGARGVTWAGDRWFVRVVASLALASMTGTTLVVIFTGVTRESTAWGFAPPLWFALFSALCLWFYRTRHRDLYILAACLLAVIIVITSLVARMGSGDAGFVLFVGFLILGQTAAAATWLKRVAEQWRDSP